MDKIRLEIIGMSYSQSQSGAYALIMGEVGSKRRLPIIIGGFEAQAIAIELEKMKPSRPLTHDLLKKFADTYNVIIKEVIINKFHEGVFFAKLICEQGGIINEIDSRTSDAVALAIRFHCPIYTYEKILAEAGIILDETIASPFKKQKIQQKKGNVYGDYSLNELHILLKKAIDNEEYEKASEIRDEINRRKKV
ncbi:MAG: bifunctional nuclease family protein [Bacteroidetes bacterium]|nr:bifunctional nuclease family protein [Bacteroidota bacterium]